MKGMERLKIQTPLFPKENGERRIREKGSPLWKKKKKYGPFLRKHVNTNVPLTNIKMVLEFLGIDLYQTNVLHGLS